MSEGEGGWGEGMSDSRREGKTAKEKTGKHTGTRGRKKMGCVNKHTPQIHSALAGWLVLAGTRRNHTAEEEPDGGELSG